MDVCRCQMIPSSLPSLIHFKVPFHSTFVFVVHIQSTNYGRNNPIHICMMRMRNGHLYKLLFKFKCFLIILFLLIVFLPPYYIVLLIYTIRFCLLNVCVKFFTYVLLSYNKLYYTLFYCVPSPLINKYNI